MMDYAGGTNMDYTWPNMTTPTQHTIALPYFWQVPIGKLILGYSALFSGLLGIAGNSLSIATLTYMSHFSSTNLYFIVLMDIRNR